jgi:hypothetical protein
MEFGLNAVKILFSQHVYDLAPRSDGSYFKFVFKFDFVNLGYEPWNLEPTTHMC